jgi:isochorismate pyruvate lyase
MSVQRVFTGTDWEQQVAYCRAIRVGNQILVSGTVPVGEDGQTFAPNDAYAQTRCCLAIIEQALQELGADCSHIVRTRMFVTDMGRWADYARAHREVFANHPPTSTMVEIQGLVNLDMTVEIEAEAIVLQ